MKHTMKQMRSLAMPMNPIRGALTLVLIFALLIVAAARPAHAQTEVVMYTFCSRQNCADGEGPASSLAPDGAGNFYGTTQLGGANMRGTVFELSPNGVGGFNETVLYSFCSLPYCTDGNEPTSNVIFDGAGNLYGTACSGGANGQAVPSACVNPRKLADVRLRDPGEPRGE
ncbi:MAG: choice-of-anchor tandem repeat GloVer-containing protein [Terriglobales bacterium]